MWLSEQHLTCHSPGECEREGETNEVTETLETVYEFDCAFCVTIFPLTICSFKAVNVHCSACVLGLSGLLQLCSTDLARSQHAMNVYRRQTHPKSPDPPFIQSDMALLLSTHLFYAHANTNIFLVTLFLIFLFQPHCCEFWELTWAFLFIFFNSVPLISYSIFSSFPELCYPLIPPSSGILSFFCPSPSFLQPSLNSRETQLRAGICTLLS